MSLARRKLAAILAAAWSRRFDALTLLGCAVVAWGVAYIYFPAGIIVAGLVVGVWGVIGSWVRKRP